MFGRFDMDLWLASGGDLVVRCGKGAMFSTQRYPRIYQKLDSGRQGFGLYI
jgi:hypothetical protein